MDQIELARKELENAAAVMPQEANDSNLEAGDGQSDLQAENKNSETSSKEHKDKPRLEEKPQANPPPVLKALAVTASESPNQKFSRSGRKIKPKRKPEYEVPRATRKQAKIASGKAASTSAATSASNSDERMQQILQDPARTQFLMTQYRMIQATQEVKLSLGIDKIELEVPKALQAAKALRDEIFPNVTQLMLLKYPDVVITIKKLGNYVGNIAKWQMTGEEQKDFQEKAAQLRQIAAEIFASLQVLKN